MLGVTIAGDLRFSLTLSGEGWGRCGEDGSIRGAECYVSLWQETYGSVRGRQEGNYRGYLQLIIVAGLRLLWVKAMDWYGRQLKWQLLLYLNSDLTTRQ